MKSILNLTYPATFKFSFMKAEIKDGKAFMNTYDIRQAFDVKSHADLENLIQTIAKKCVVNPSNINFKIINESSSSLYEKEYEIYFNSLNDGEDALSLKEFVECMKGGKS
ncbi:hypothetical protein DCF83_18070 (plasmid) [Edwardsiella tarda]|uniref:hypothetical protein n=1 Tax=Edwardsiella tarda TaxID=636 RepID=UPI001FA6AE40|nr:hypothetical protein [Edwardsiella tarda]UCQ29626.1 hypothetical protein DCF83_18070 [Edwardsiella tarda]